MEMLSEEAVKYIWDGAIPLQIHLHESEVTTLPAPPPALVLGSRNGYLPLLIPQIKPHFDSTLPPGVDTVWFDYKGVPLKWYIPIGVLFDLLCAEPERPWNLTVHFRGYPAELLTPCDGEEAVKWSFINSLKEAAYIINGNCKSIMNMSQADQYDLWQSVLNGNLENYARVVSKIKIGSLSEDCKARATETSNPLTNQTGRIPVRLYIRNVEETDDLEDVEKIDGWEKVSYINRPVENREEEGIFTLEKAMESLLPELLRKSKSEERESSDEADPGERRRIRVIRIQGIMPSWDTPFAWVVNNLCHPDFFLHTIVALKKGAHVLRCGKRGKPKFCRLRLSSDETALIWYSGQEERSLILNSVAKILHGQQTVNFLRHPQPGKEAQSMSLIYHGGGESFDLIGEDKEQAETWFLGLKAMVSRSHHLFSSGHASRMRPEKLTQVDNGEHQSTSARNHQSLRRIYTSEDSSYSPSISQSKSLKEGSRERNPCKTPKTKVNAAVHEEEVPMDMFLWGEDYAILPRILKSTHSLNARKIFCGDQCAAVVNDHGGVFTWGKERGGRLGHKTNEDVARPKLVDSLAGDNVESIAYGASYACALTRSGQVYTWGENYQGDGGNQRSPWLPRRLYIPSSAVSISEIACGDWHTAIVSSFGQLFTYGDGGFGVLGHGNLKSFSQPKEVEALRGMKVKSVACGLWHTAAVVELRGDLSGGKLFTWGDNDDGKLGHPWKEKTLVPTAVAALEDEGFLQVSCGMTMTVALTVKGKVFTMGSFVTKVEGALEGEYVKEISAGSFHVAVLTLKGEVYTWGKGANGRLGLGDTEDRDSPACVEALKGRAVQSIACGSSFTAAICLHEPVLSCEQFECSGCRLAFGLTRKKHSCYSCRQLFCRSCTRRNALKKQSRVCDSCFKQLSSEGSGLLERETASPRLTLLLKKGLFALKNDLRNQVEGRKNSSLSSLCPVRTRRWGQVDCPPFFSEFQTNHETKRGEESKVCLPDNQLSSKSMSFPSSRLKTEYKKPDRTLFDELEQLRKEVNASGEKAPAAGEIRSLGSILNDKISRTPDGVHGSEESQKDRLGCDSGDRLPAFDSSAGTKSGADRSRQIGSSEPIALSTAAKKTEWVEEDEPGVYITFVILPSGRKGLKRVRFSRRRFSQKDAEKWWKENQMRVHLKYHTEGQMENTVDGTVDSRRLYKS